MWQMTNDKWKITNDKQIWDHMKSKLSTQNNKSIMEKSKYLF